MRSTFRPLFVVAAAAILVLAAAGCASAASSGMPDARVHPEWQHHMEAGLEASDVGRPGAAAIHYRRAVAVARSEGLPSEELAFSTYRLGEAIRIRPGAGRGESALALLDESRRHFEAAYGANHPVLIPVWIRIATLHADAGDLPASDAARAAADRIAVRFFPESHFLRERYGAARPAAMLHPLEVLQLTASHPITPERVVQGP